MKIRVSQAVGFLCLVVAGLCITDGLYLKGKAILAQHLLLRAWEKTADLGTPVKPWPWADTWPIARLQVERLGIDCIVLEGDSGEVLAFGPGHISASARPAAAGNCVLVGHRDTTFRFLEDIEKGDILTLRTFREHERSYKVVSTMVKESSEVLLKESVTPWLTLITCYPFGALQSGGNERFVVFAREYPSGGAHLAAYTPL